MKCQLAYLTIQCVHICQEAYSCLGLNAGWLNISCRRQANTPHTLLCLASRHLHDSNDSLSYNIHFIDNRD